MTEMQVTAEPGVPQILTAREFDAPRDLLYRAFTEPELLAQWLGPHRLTMTVERFDLREGGTWRYVHADEDGNAFGFHGVFHGEPSPDGGPYTALKASHQPDLDLFLNRLEERLQRAGASVKRC